MWRVNKKDSGTRKMDISKRKRKLLNYQTLWELHHVNKIKHQELV